MATDAKMLPQPEPRAVGELSHHDFDLQPRGRSALSGLVSGTANDALQPLDLGNRLFRRPSVSIIQHEALQRVKRDAAL